MNCPQCDSDDIEETGKFDGTNIDPSECIHDFECHLCGCLFNIYYLPASMQIYEFGTNLEPE